MVGWQEIRVSPKAARPWPACYFRGLEGGQQHGSLERASAAEGVDLVVCRDLDWTTSSGPAPLGMLFDCSGGQTEECARWILSTLKPDLAEQVESSNDPAQATQLARELLCEVASSVPIAAMVASNEVDRVGQLMRAGVSEVFAKPVCTLRFRRWLRERIAARRASGDDISQDPRPPLSAR